MDSSGSGRSPIISRSANESPPIDTITSQSALRCYTNPLPVTSSPTNSSVSEATNSQSALRCYTNPLPVTASPTNSSVSEATNSQSALRCYTNSLPVASSSTNSRVVCKQRDTPLKSSLKQKRARFLEHSRSVTAALRSLRSRSLSSSHDLTPPVNVTQYEPDRSPQDTQRSLSPTCETGLTASPHSTASSDSRSTQLSSCSSHRRLLLTSLSSPAREEIGTWRSCPAPYSSAFSTPITPFTESPLVTSERLQQEQNTAMLSPRPPSSECGGILSSAPPDDVSRSQTLTCSDASCLYNTQTLTENEHDSRCLCGARMVDSRGNSPAVGPAAAAGDKEGARALECKQNQLTGGRARQKILPTFNSCASSLSEIPRLQEDEAVTMVGESASRLSTSRQNSNESAMVATV